MHSSIAIANHLITLSRNGLTLMHIMKLSYFSHGFKLGMVGANHPLANEFVQAWKFGPVFPNLYHKFKYEPPGIIKRPARYFDEKTNSLQVVQANFNSDEVEIMKTVYQIYGDLDAWQLSALTHQEGTPWHKAWHENHGDKGFFGITIPNEEIAKHFKQKIEQCISNDE